MYRVQFGFNEQPLFPLKDYTVWFTPLAMLLNRLLTKYYIGKEIEMVDISFFSITPPDIEPYFYIKYDRVLVCKETIDCSEIELSDKSNKLIWERVYLSLKAANTKYNFPGFDEALNAAYAEGLSINLSLDYIYKEKQISYNEMAYKAIYYMKFTENIDELTVVFKLEKDGKIITEQPIMQGQRHEGIFLYALKTVSFDRNGDIVIRGMNNVCKMVFPIKVKVTHED